MPNHCVTSFRQLHQAGAPLLLPNAWDVVSARLSESAARADETVRRAMLYARAGTDGLFVPGLSARTDIQQVVAATRLPLNLMAWDGLPDAAGLAALGVRRLSAGSAIAQRAAGFTHAVARSFLDTGASDALLAGAKPFAEVQQLFRAA